MNVENAIGKRRNKKGRQKAHVACEADELDFVLVQDRDDLAVVSFAFQAFRRNRAGRYAASFGTIEAGRALAVAEDNGDFRVWYPARRDAFRKSLEIRTAPA